MVKYVRLLSYDNACKVVDFVNANDKEDYSYITTGGVAIQVSEKNWLSVQVFIKSLGVRYEITDEAPYKVKEKIVDELKASGVIAGDSESWISTKERFPNKTGWYKVKLNNGSVFDAPLSRTFGGKMVWVIPEVNEVAYWQECDC